MAYTGLLSVFLSILLVCCEGRPSDSATKQKRMVPVLVHRNPVYDLGSWHSADLDDPLPFATWESKSKAMKELLDVLGLKVPENLAEFAMREKIKKPPKYMIDLYNAIADDNGITRNPGLLDADTVRSIPNLGPPGSKFCKFDLSAVTDNETIINAELHLFQSQRTSRKNSDNSATQANFRHTPFARTYIVKIYQLLSEYNSTNPERKLISARRVHSHHSGWHVFPILSTVRNWVNSAATNHGLLTEITAPSGGTMENVLDRESLQPILVVFTNNTIPKSNYTDLEDESKGKDQTTQSEKLDSTDDALERVSTEGLRSKRSASNEKPKSRRGRNRKKDHVENVPVDASQSRVTQDLQYGDFNHDQTETRRREWTDEYVYPDIQRNYEINRDDYDYFSDGSENPQSGSAKNNQGGMQSGTHNPKPYTSFSSGNGGKLMRNCRRYPLYVNFEEMGWSGWIIHPQGYNAYHCKGVCSFPLGQQLNPTNHATVQSIMHTLGLGNQPVDMPCCTPDELYDINLLYFDENDYVVLRRYKDMVAASCACR